MAFVDEGVPKPLGQLRPTSTGAELLYSPSSGITQITEVVITSTDSNATTWSLWLDIDGSTYNDLSVLFEDQVISYPMTVQLAELSWYMNPDSNLAVKNATADTVLFTLFGIERP